MGSSKNPFIFDLPHQKMEELHYRYYKPKGRRIPKYSTSSVGRMKNLPLYFSYSPANPVRPDSCRFRCSVSISNSTNRRKIVISPLITDPKLGSDISYTCRIYNLSNLYILQPKRRATGHYHSNDTGRWRAR